VGDAYDKEFEALQLALVEWQTKAIAEGQKVLIIFEGRDAAGKDGTIRRLVENLSVRQTRIFAPAKPSDKERTQWYFQRFVPALPSGGETVVFNRSWYNRAGVERVMGFCSPEESESFLHCVPEFEDLLTRSDIRLIKLWLDISKAEQATRLTERKSDPIKALKRSPLDEEAQKRWDAYTEARDEMLKRTSTDHHPWICVRGDQKKAARMNVLRHLVRTLSDAKAEKPDKDVLFEFDAKALKDGRLER